MAPEHMLQISQSTPRPYKYYENIKDAFFYVGLSPEDHFNLLLSFFFFTIDVMCYTVYNVMHKTT